MANENAKAVEAVHTVEAVETKSEKAVNKTVTRCKLLCAKLNKNEEKIGIALLDYSAVINNGQLDCVTLENPVITKWFEVTDELKALINKPVMSDVACIVSGEGNFTVLHEILSDAKYKAYMAIVGR